MNRPWLFAIFFVLCAPLTLAQVSRSGGGDATARLQAMLQQERAKVAELTASTQRLEKEKGKADARIAALESQLESAKRGQENLNARLQRSAQNAESQASALATTRTRFDELLSKSREIAGALRDTELRLSDVSGELQVRTSELGDCAAKNAQLGAINDEMVAYLRGEGGGLANLLSREPFTGIRKVRRENMADDFEYRADEHTVAPHKTAE